MLQGPTIFKQTVEGTRAGFDSLVNLVQTEAAMMQRNRLAASERASEMAQYAAKTQMDIQKQIAIEQAKAQVEAVAPLSNSAVQNQRFQRENQLNNILTNNAEMFRGMGIARIQSEWDPNTQTFFDYYVKQVDEGQFAKVYVDQSRLSELNNIFTEATTVRNQLESIVQAGLDPIQHTVGDATYYGAADINKILTRLDSENPEIVVKALEEYKNNRNRIPSLDLVKQSTKSQSEAERKETNEFLASVGKMNALFTNNTMLGAFDTVPALNRSFLENESIGTISAEIKNRIRTLTMKYGGDANKLSKEPEKYMIYISLSEFDKTLDNILNNYSGLTGSRPGKNNELYWNYTWSPGQNSADVLIHRSQRNQSTETVSVAPKNTTLDATQNALNLTLAVTR